MITRRPLYEINLFNAESNWTPEPYQIVRWPNPSRLNSLWVGLVAPVMMLPGRLWNEVARPFFCGHFGFSGRMLVFIVTSSFAWLAWGLRGHAFVIDLPPEVLACSRFMDCDEAQADYLDRDSLLIRRVGGW